MVLCPEPGVQFVYKSTIYAIILDMNTDEGEAWMTGNLQFPSHMVILDRSMYTHYHEALYAFALEELLCRKIGQGAVPLVHIWRHPRAFVMGLRDSRLPGALEARLQLSNEGYSTAVRNSGGAAVPLDLGVVNISLLLPKREGMMDYRKEFELMYALVRESMLSLTAGVEKGEIAGSFCPGEFDLSLGGRKFCGIAQRRQQHALSVQAFVIVEGSGGARGETARRFYERAGAAGEDYPHVIPGTMGSVAECLGKAVTVDSFLSGLYGLLRSQGVSEAAGPDILPDEDEIQEMIKLLKARYEKDSLDDR